MVNGQATQALTHRMTIFYKYIHFVINNKTSIIKNLVIEPRGTILITVAKK